MKTMTMKDKNKYVGLLLCMFALAPWMFGACDDKLGGDTTTSIEFPTDTLNKVVSPGDTVAVEFNAATNWKVVSNRNWCVTTDGYMDAAGKSGKHTVSFIINDKGHGFVEDMAEVTLWMGNENQVVANITRRAKGYFMELCNSDSSLYAVGESMTHRHIIANCLICGIRRHQTKVIILSHLLLLCKHCPVHKFIVIKRQTVRPIMRLITFQHSGRVIFG